VEINCRICRISEACGRSGNLQVYKKRIRYGIATKIGLCACRKTDVTLWCCGVLMWCQLYGVTADKAH